MGNVTAGITVKQMVYINEEGLECRAIVSDDINEIVEQATFMLVGVSALHHDAIVFYDPETGDTIDQLDDEAIRQEFSCEFFLGEESWWRDNVGILSLRAFKKNEKWDCEVTASNKSILQLVLDNYSKTMNKINKAA